MFLGSKTLDFTAFGDCITINNRAVKLFEYEGFMLIPLRSQSVEPSQSEKLGFAFMWVIVFVCELTLLACVLFVR